MAVHQKSAPGLHGRQGVAAFTLLEAMAVVAILGIVAAIAIPPLLPQVHRAQISGESEAVASFVARARMDALTSRRCVRVRIASANAPIRLVAERLNNFDCDKTPQTFAGGAGIDGTTTQWIETAVLTIGTQSLRLDFDPVPSETTTAALNGAGHGAGEPPQLRYRPTGRLWSLDTDLTDDDGVLKLTHAQLEPAQNTAKILFDAAGPICVLGRGKSPAGSGNNLSCP